MNIGKQILVAILVTGFAGPIAAQQEPERESQIRAVEVEVRMRQAEKQLEEAARRIAELSSMELSRVGEIEKHFAFDGRRAVMGITIGSESKSAAAVDGVTVMAISPGGSADEAGLRAGDVIVELNGESLAAENAMSANAILLDFMQGVEEGDILEVDYKRDNNMGTVELRPKLIASSSFRFNFGGRPFAVPAAPNAAAPVIAYNWVSKHSGHGFGDMEMVELNASLGRYFGTESGLLIVKAPADNSFKLQDGDVIVNIDGRTPSDLLHAVRILNSYQSGETLNIEIMRDKRKETLSVRVPDNRRSSLLPPAFPAPAAVDDRQYRIVRKREERT